MCDQFVVIFSYGMPGDMFHLVGHSLGAHAVVYFITHNTIVT